MLKSFCVVSNLIIKNNIRNYARRKHLNPGISHTVNLYKKEGLISSENEVDMEFLEETEGNFYNVNEMEKEYTKEIKQKKEELSTMIVGRKYFNENLPNFLTWSEKEQIRHLHNKDPNEWTAFKIAESFPVTEEVAKKLIKATWKPATQNRIDRHDAGALRNWKELKNGTLEGITSEMREHFLKYTNRVIPPRSHIDVQKTLELNRRNNTKGEYSSILQIHKEAENTFEQITSNNETRLQLKSGSEDFGTSTNLKKNHSPKITLNKLRENLKERLEIDDDISDSDKHLIKPSEEIEHVDYEDPQLKKSYLTNIEREAKHLNKLEEKKADQIVQHDFTKRIRIPKKLYKRDGTYKVNDCFYDSDGTFLYKVPGLVSSFNNASETPESDQSSSL